jgi:integrase
MNRTRSLPAPRRLDRRDPHLAIAELFDPSITQWLWESLPEECQRERFDKRSMPDRYRPFVAEESAGGPWTTSALNFTAVPRTITQELAWLTFREVQLGRTVSPSAYATAVRIVRRVTADERNGVTAGSLLSMPADDWVRLARLAAMRDGATLARSVALVGSTTLRRWQDTLCYAYHRGPWWELDVWNPVLDSRIPRRAHEPMGRNVVNFSHLTTGWLREAAKWWLSQALITEAYTWTSVKTRLDGLKWFQRALDTSEDANGPLLIEDHDLRREFFIAMASMLKSHIVTHGATKGKPLGKTARAQAISTVEQFYRFMYDNRHRAAKVLGDDRWGRLDATYTVPFRLEDKPRGRNKLPTLDRILEDDVLSQIAVGMELVAKPRDEGGLGDLQALHILALLIATGRRVNEILMMDFDPLTSLIAGPEVTEGDETALVARMRYQRTKIESSTEPSIPVNLEVVKIIRAQQLHVRELMRARGIEQDPPYLFLRTMQNSRGEAPYSSATFNLRMSALSERMGIKDSTGRPVSISKTHNFRHTKATSLLNAGVPLHVVMRYFGHITPAMTMHYAQTLSETAEAEFLRYRKIKADGREVAVDPGDLFDLMHLSQRADRILPNGWCMLAPGQFCGKGNACLTCGDWATDESHRPDLERQLTATDQLVEHRCAAFAQRYGQDMPEDNIWLAERRKEQGALRKVLITLDELKVRPDAAPAVVRGVAANDQPEVA